MILMNPLKIPYDPSMALKDKIVQEFRQSHLKLQAFRSLQESCKLLVTLRAYCIITSPISVQSRIRKYADLFLSKTRVKMILDDDEINQLITFISAREAQTSSTDSDLVIQASSDSFAGFSKVPAGNDCDDIPKEFLNIQNEYIPKEFLNIQNEYIPKDYKQDQLDNNQSRARTYTQEWSLAGIDGDENTEGVRGRQWSLDDSSSWDLAHCDKDLVAGSDILAAGSRVHIGAKVSRRPQLSPTEITRLTPIHLNVVVPRVWPRYTKLAALQIVQYYRDCQISVEPAPLTYAEVCWLEALTKETIGGWYDDSCGGER